MQSGRVAAACITMAPGCHRAPAEVDVPGMTTTFLLFGVPLLALAGGIAAWRVHGRRRRIGNVAAVSAEPVPTVPEPVRAAEQPAPGQSGSSCGGILSRMRAIAFDEEAGDDRRMNPADAAHAQVARAASATLSHIAPGSRYAPRRPQLLPQLLNVVNDDASSGREIAGIIARDPALTGNLLRIANSALYRVRPEPIENIERAVVLIGTDGLRQMIAVALMQPVLNGGPGAFGRLPSIIWEHTLLSAVAAAEYARQVERIDAFSAQMLGLLHGLGSIVVVQVARDGYEKHPALAPDPGVVDRLLERWAARTARGLARDWVLPGRIEPALDDQRREVPLGKLSPLARSLHVGRFAGAAAMLHRSGRMDAEAALALMQQELELREDVAARIWERISRT